MFEKIQKLVYNIIFNRSLRVHKVNDFYIPGNSAWPFLLSSSIFCLMLSTVAYMQYYRIALVFMFLSFISIIVVCSFWWWDLIIETQTYELFTPLVQRNIRLGMVLFILSEVFFFFSFFWAFFHSSLSPSIAIGGIWPPDHFFMLRKVIDPWDVALVNTAFLLVSGLLVSFGHHSLKLREMEDAFFGIFFCLFCAGFFIGWQFYEYYYEELLLSDGIYGSCFFMLTGFHGLHVIGGTLFLVVCIIRLRYLHFHDGRHVGLDCAVWYWHFVDVVWIFLFIFVYVWGNSPNESFSLITNI
jgi:heme/copper-type cytochrome/quinol oxidase subunit 3